MMILIFPLLPYVSALLLALYLDSTFFTPKFIYLNIFILLSYMFGVLSVRIFYPSASRYVQVKPHSSALLRLILIVVIPLYLLIYLYIFITVGRIYGFTNLGGYRVFVEYLVPSTILNLKSLLFLILVLALFHFNLEKRFLKGFLLTIMLSTTGAIDGAKASVLIPFCYYLFSYWYSIGRARNVLLIIIISSVITLVIAYFFDFDGNGVLRLIGFYLANGIFNFANTISGDFTPVSFHLTRFENFFYGQDKPLFVYDKIEIRAFSTGSNTAAAPALYFNLLGSFGLTLFFFILGAFLQLTLLRVKKTMFRSLTFTLLASATFFAFFEDFYINNYLLVIKLMIIAYCLRLSQSMLPVKSRVMHRNEK